MAINLPSIFHWDYLLRLLEMVFQDIEISKFSGETCPQLPPFVTYRFDEILRLDSLLNAGIGLVTILKCRIFLGSVLTNPPSGNWFNISSPPVQKYWVRRWVHVNSFQRY